MAGWDGRSAKLHVSPSPSGSPFIKSPPCRSRSSDQVGHLVPGSLPPFTMSDLDFLVMEGASLAPRDPVVSLARTKTRAQHAAVVLAGSRKPSNIKCVVDSTLFYTMPNDIPLQVQDPLTPSPASQPEVHQESCIPALSPPAVGKQIHNQQSVPPVEDSKSNFPLFDLSQT